MKCQLCLHRWQCTLDEPEEKGIAESIIGQITQRGERTERDEF